MTFRSALALHYNSFHIIYIMRELEKAGLFYGLTGEPRQTDILSNYDVAWCCYAYNTDHSYWGENPIGA